MILVTAALLHDIGNHHSVPDSTTSNWSCSKRPTGSYPGLKATEFMLKKQFLLLMQGHHAMRKRLTKIPGRCKAPLRGQRQ